MDGCQRSQCKFISKAFTRTSKRDVAVMQTASLEFLLPTKQHRLQIFCKKLPSHSFIVNYKASIVLILHPAAVNRERELKYTILSL